MKPLVSVIVPTFNRAHIIGRALDSIFAQTFQDFEVIVVDDGSKDTTQEWLSRYPHPIRCLYQENSGPAAARNKGMAVAKGEYIAFLDSDDSYFPRNLEAHLLRFEKEPEVGLIYAGSEIVDSEGTFIKELRPKPENRGQVLSQLVFYNFIMPSTVVMRRSCMEYAGPMNDRLWFAEDWLYWLKIASRFQFDYIDEVLVRFQRSLVSATRRPLRELVAINMEMFDYAFSDPDLGPRISAYKNQAYSRAYIGYVKMALEGYDRLFARELVFKAIPYNPTKLSVYLLLLKTLLNQKILRWGRRLTRRVS
jgi:glycosyltransferase involved in cell wall biosynthesis